MKNNIQTQLQKSKLSGLTQDLYDLKNYALLVKLTMTEKIKPAIAKLNQNILQIALLYTRLFLRKHYSYSFVNSDSILTQTQILTLKLMPSLTLIQTLT